MRPACPSNENTRNAAARCRTLNPAGPPAAAASALLKAQAVRPRHAKRKAAWNPNRIQVSRVLSGYGAGYTQVLIAVCCVAVVVPQPRRGPETTTHGPTTVTACRCSQADIKEKLTYVALDYDAEVERARADVGAGRTLLQAARNRLAARPSCPERKEKKRKKSPSRYSSAHS